MLEARTVVDERTDDQEAGWKKKKSSSKNWLGKRKNLGKKTITRYRIRSRVLQNIKPNLITVSSTQGANPRTWHKSEPLAQSFSSPTWFYSKLHGRMNALPCRTAFFIISLNPRSILWTRLDINDTSNHIDHWHRRQWDCPKEFCSAAVQLRQSSRIWEFPAEKPKITETASNETRAWTTLCLLDSTSQVRRSS